ncbi:DUF2806 domain-containing protein [Halobacteriovorax sp.]|uniref:DUF2806 domain-containing protein n=1 Tax=Halobacteriovorax sp. TaxID=2020862 RepID=UPI003AF308C0
MDIKNLSGLEKPLTKLIEVVSKGTGILYEPTRIKRKALAEAESLKIKSSAISEVLRNYEGEGAIALVCENNELEFKEVTDFSKRLVASRDYQESLEQRNVESIVANSIEFIGDFVTDEEVDADWRKRFFKKAKDISHEEMQKVWGKVLAGEVEKPGSYSMRSLELLSNLTQYEAEIFRRISRYVELINGYILIPHNNVRSIGFNDEFPYGVLLKLIDCGLLMPQFDLGLNFELLPGYSMPFQFKSCSLMISNKNSQKVSARMSILSLTSSGRELINLVEGDSWSREYFVQLKENYKKLTLSLT